MVPDEFVFEHNAIASWEEEDGRHVAIRRWDADGNGRWEVAVHGSRTVTDDFIRENADLILPGDPAVIEDCFEQVREASREASYTMVRNMLAYAHELYGASLTGISTISNMFERMVNEGGVAVQPAAEAPEEAEAPKEDVATGEPESRHFMKEGK